AAGPLLAQQATQQPQPPANPQQRRGTMQEVPPFEGPLDFKSSATPPKVQPFPMAQVRLLAGPFKDAQEWNRASVTQLPTDRLLHNVRVNAGLPSSATPFGGWEKPGTDRGSELRGHFTGHYLSACALLYASTGDKEIKARGDSMVADLAQCQQKLGGKYLSA